MFEKSFKRVSGKRAERIFAMKIILICAIFGIVALFLLRDNQNTESDMLTLSNVNNEFQITSTGTNNSNGASGVTDSVPILEKGVVEDIAVEQGCIVIVDESNLPNELPICMTPEVVADWYQVVAVKGGYEPIGGLGLFWNNKEIPEYINGYGITATFIGMADPDNEYCCWALWKFTFDTQCENVWCFESSYYPEIAEEEGIIPGKLIDFRWCTTWQGCEKVDQRFTVILVTQRVLQTPKSPLGFRW